MSIEFICTCHMLVNPIYLSVVILLNCPDISAWYKEPMPDHIKPWPKDSHETSMVCRQVTSLPMVGDRHKGQNPFVQIMYVHIMFYTEDETLKTLSD